MARCCKNKRNEETKNGKLLIKTFPTLGKSQISDADGIQILKYSRILPDLDDGVAGQLRDEGGALAVLGVPQA